jgi:hypothetical protein
MAGIVNSPDVISFFAAKPLVGYGPGLFALETAATKNQIVVS